MLLLLALALGVVAIVYAMKKSSPTVQPLSCPTCFSFFESSGAPGDIVRCKDCGSYAQVDATNTTSSIAADRVAPTHVFRTYLPESAAWPATCCLCAAPATRAEPLTIHYSAEVSPETRLQAGLAVGVLSLGTLEVSNITERVSETVGVPHCNDHGGGALLAHSSIGFRSYRYYKEFVKLNRATPGGVSRSA